jgi:hypothetical protein
MPPDRLDEANARLADPPVADAHVSRHMGLFAVAHLAARHGALVRLQPAVKGTVAQVWLPPAITAGGIMGPAPTAGIAGHSPARSGGYLRTAALRQSGAQQAAPRPETAGPPVWDATARRPRPSAVTPPPPPAAGPDDPPGPGGPVSSSVARARTEAGLPSRIPRTRRSGRHASPQPGDTSPPE